MNYMKQGIKDLYRFYLFYKMLPTTVSKSFSAFNQAHEKVFKKSITPEYMEIINKYLNKPKDQ